MYRMQSIPAEMAVGIWPKAKIARRLYLRFHKEEIAQDCPVRHDRLPDPRHHRRGFARSQNP